MAIAAAAKAAKAAPLLWVASTRAVSACSLVLTTLPWLLLLRRLVPLVLPLVLRLRLLGPWQLHLLLAPWLLPLLLRRRGPLTQRVCFRQEWL